MYMYMSSRGQNTAIWQRSAEEEASPQPFTLVVGCRGFVGGLGVRLRRVVGMTGSSLRKTIKWQSKFVVVSKEKRQQLGLNTPTRSVTGSGVGRHPCKTRCSAKHLRTVAPADDPATDLEVHWRRCGRQKCQAVEALQWNFKTSEIVLQKY